MHFPHSMEADNQKAAPPAATPLADNVCGARKVRLLR
jgi:hypothetical protein